MSAALDILKTVVPGIATALGGPLAGIATSWIASKLGIEEKTADAIADAVQGIDPLKRQQLEQEFSRWFIEQQHRELETYIKDTQDARARDSMLRVSGQRNHRADTMYVLSVVVIVGIVYGIWTKTVLDDYVKGILTLVLGRFLGYLDQIYSFEFGTTRSSKSKDEVINKLSER